MDPITATTAITATRPDAAGTRRFAATASRGTDSVPPLPSSTRPAAVTGYQPPLLSWTTGQQSLTPFEQMMQDNEASLARWFPNPYARTGMELMGTLLSAEV